MAAKKERRKNPLIMWRGAEKSAAERSEITVNYEDSPFYRIF